jgi:hypothetical protein
MKKKNKEEEIITFDVEYVNKSKKFKVKDSINIPLSIITSPIINHCTQRFAWDKNKVQVSFSDDGQLKFTIIE